MDNGARQSDADESRLRTIRAGTVLAREGSPVGVTLLVVDGRAWVRRDGDVVGLLGSGDIVEAATRSGVTIIADTDLRIASLDADSAPSSTRTQPQGGRE